MRWLIIRIGTEPVSGGIQKPLEYMAHGQNSVFWSPLLSGKTSNMKSLHKKCGPKYRDFLRSELEVFGPGTSPPKSVKYWRCRCEVCHLECLGLLGHTFWPRLESAMIWAMKIIVSEKEKMLASKCPKLLEIHKLSSVWAQLGADRIVLNAIGSGWVQFERN